MMRWRRVRRPSPKWSRGLTRRMWAPIGQRRPSRSSAKRKSLSSRPRSIGSLDGVDRRDPAVGMCRQRRPVGPAPDDLGRQPLGLGLVAAGLVAQVVPERRDVLAQLAHDHVASRCGSAAAPERRATRARPRRGSRGRTRPARAGPTPAARGRRCAPARCSVAVPCPYHGPARSSAIAGCANPSAKPKCSRWPGSPPPAARRRGAGRGRARAPPGAPVARGPVPSGLAGVDRHEHVRRRLVPPRFPAVPGGWGPSSPSSPARARIPARNSSGKLASTRSSAPSAAQPRVAERDVDRRLGLAALPGAARWSAAGAARASQRRPASASLDRARRRAATCSKP